MHGRAWEVELQEQLAGEVHRKLGSWHCGLSEDRMSLVGLVCGSLKAEENKINHPVSESDSDAWMLLKTDCMCVAKMSHTEHFIYSMCAYLSMSNASILMYAFTVLVLLLFVLFCLFHPGFLSYVLILMFVRIIVLVLF